MANNIQIAEVLRSFVSGPRQPHAGGLPFPSSPALEAWLALDVLPATLPWYGDGMYLVSATSIAQAQTGYAVLGDGKPAKDWPQDWVVVGDVSSDPVIANPAIEGTPVLYAVHGAGKWAGELLAPTLAAFAEGLALWLMVTGESGSALEHSRLRPPVEDAVRTQIANVVGTECLPLWLGRHWLG